MSEVCSGNTKLTFDDVLLKPAASDVIPTQTNVNTRFSRNIKLNMPIISAAMDTVTETKMAIAMAQAGGIGVIHRNMNPEKQAAQVQQVKKFQSAIVYNPETITPEQTLKKTLQIMQKFNISGIPVCQSEKSNKLVGIITHRDIRFATDLKKPVKEFMTSENLITVNDKTNVETAKKILHQHRIEKLIVINDNYECIGLITVKDIERTKLKPASSKDDKGRLLVAAAIGTGEEHLKRAEILIDADVDAIVVDTSHGHSKNVIDCVKILKKNYPDIDIIAGNIATSEGAEALIKAGADAVKVGIGPGAVCTTRIIAGVGVPQFSAILETAKITNRYNVPLIADGGVRNSGDLAKALAAGAEITMIGSLLAGTNEAPGEVFVYNGRNYKTYRGMGSVEAMAKGSADRYFQQEVNQTAKLVPEGVAARVPYTGDLDLIIHQLIGGLKASMGYTGCQNLEQFARKTQFIKVSNAALRENHVHDVAITHDNINYYKF